MKFLYCSSWEQLPDSTNALFERAAKDNIFYSRQWFEILTTNALDDSPGLVLAFAIAGDKVMAIRPLMGSGGQTWYSLKHRLHPTIAAACR